MARFTNSPFGEGANFDEQGCLNFPASGEICNVPNSSGDGLNLSTMQINPDTTYNDDRYIVIDPTVPNHVHIRAGGPIDDSNAELILGGEKANVRITDYNHAVSVISTNTIYDPEIDDYYESSNYWSFGNDGTFYGPAMGGLLVNFLANGNTDLPIFSPNGSVVLIGTNGEYLSDPTVPTNQIATIGDIDSTVSTDKVRYSPTFTATGLTFTGSGVTYPTYNSYYVKSGKMVSFVIEVDCSTVTNFGTGQYKLQLPFTPAVGYNHFTGWANVDPAVNPDVPTGHIILNVDHAGVTDVLDLHYLKQAGGAHTPIVEGLFLQDVPVTLTTSSKIYVNGTYIAA